MNLLNKHLIMNKENFIAHLLNKGWTPVDDHLDMNNNGLLISVYVISEYKVVVMVNANADATAEFTIKQYEESLKFNIDVIQESAKRLANGF